VSVASRQTPARRSELWWWGERVASALAGCASPFPSRPALAKSLPSAGSNVVRPIRAASQSAWNSLIPWLCPEVKAGSATTAGQPPGVVT
jgi:hypothetical protein